VIRAAFGVAGYRLRATFRRRWGGYVALVVLIGLIGGLGLGSLAAARRTQSSFSTFIASTNPSDITVSVYGGGGSAASGNPSYDPSLTAAIARLPGVRHVAAAIDLTGAPLTTAGAPRLAVTGDAYPVASVNGLLFTQDRLAVSEGRMSSPDRPDEIVMAPSVARQFGFHVGQVLPYGFYSNAQQRLPGFGTSAVPPALRINLRVVGLASLNSAIVEDDVDTFPTLLTLTPSFARQLLALKGEQFTGALIFGIQTKSAAMVPAVVREVATLIPPGAISTDHLLTPVVAKADRSLKPIAIALGVFGAVALMAALLIAAQLMARRCRVERGDLQILRALGARPSDTLLDPFVGLEAAVLTGSLLAIAVAVALSPLAPLGPVRSVDPSRGVSFDWLVLGLGVLVLLVLLSSAAALLAYSTAPHRTGLRSRIRSTAGARVVAITARAGLPAPGVIGVRMALEPGEGRAAVPVRSALLGSALAVALIVTALTFGNSLQTLVSRPALYGWNWTYILNPVGAGSGNVPKVAISLLKHDRYVAAYSGASFNEAALDGQGVPFLVENLGAAVAPPILSGHGVDGPHEVVLGAATMAALHKHLGQYVSLSYGTPADAPTYVPPTRLLIVGTATFPAIGFASTVSDHTSMGSGALFALQAFPKAFVSAFNSGADPALDGPNLALVRVRQDVSPAAALASLHRIARASDKVYESAPGGTGGVLVVQSVQRPAEIVNYKSIGLTPALLVSGLALGAIVALALTLLASVRQRRRDLALLKTIGFVRWQLASAVAWQATSAAVFGIALGIPLGIVTGRWLWDLFAKQIYAVPYPTVSVVSVLLVAIGTIVLANVIAAVPAWSAARTPTALMLRAE
jgi:hypothetical protein